MKKKLKDLTMKEYDRWIQNNCNGVYCSKCPFKKVHCRNDSPICWINNKELYSDMFLDQEVEIKPTPTEQEIEFLKMLNSEFKWVAKDNDGTVFVYAGKPFKTNTYTYWRDEQMMPCYNVSKLVKLSFDFLTWKDNEPSNIEELVKEYEEELPF